MFKQDFFKYVTVTFLYIEILYNFSLYSFIHCKYFNQSAVQTILNIDAFSFRFIAVKKTDEGQDMPLLKKPYHMKTFLSRN